MSLAQPHNLPGKLFVVEGIDGSGKSTQLKLLHDWLNSRGYPVFFTEWNSSALVRETTKKGKKKDLLTPTTFSLLHATDFADRLSYEVIPPLKAGMIVLADRYVYTAFARDVVRGVHPEWVRNLYAFAVRPDLAIYFRTPIDVALDRLLSARAKIKYHEAGMDLGLSRDVHESFRIFQSRVLSEYDQVVTEYGLAVMDAAEPINVQQERVRELVAARLEAYTVRRGSLRKSTKPFWRTFPTPSASLEP
ncbi:MAG: thymidylate kinase [Planctomycetes bacterium]|nr:thymidylate kinase [Planctomycetota bacterium]